MSSQTLILLVVIAVGHAVTIVLTGIRINAVKRDVSAVKVHTNSMVSQAVADAKLIGHSEGVAEERIESDAKAANVAIETEERIRTATVARAAVAAEQTAIDIKAAEKRMPTNEHKEDE